MIKSSGNAVIAGSALVLAYTAISSVGDAAAKYIAGDYAPRHSFLFFSAESLVLLPLPPVFERGRYINLKLKDR